jgi:hypothetical protein
MATVDPIKVSRDQKLDALDRALDDWFANESMKIDAEAANLRKMIAARGSAASLASANASASKLLVANDIASFLSG